MDSTIRFKRMLLITAIGLVALAILATGCSQGYISGEKASTPAGASSNTTSPSPENGLVQSNEGGAVTIDIKWLGQQGSNLAFEVSMNTHSVNLDQYDLKKLALLRDAGGTEYQPAGWDSAPGGHHRSGKLSFAPDSLDGSQSIKIVLKNISGVSERVFTWKFS